MEEQILGFEYVVSNDITYSFTSSTNKLKAPTTLTPSIQDISASDSGNTDDGTMWKMRIGQKITWAIAWDSVTLEEASQILTCFQQEYVTISYLSPIQNKYVAQQFYVGDRTIGSFNGVTNRWQGLSFNLIARRVVDVV